MIFHLLNDIAIFWTYKASKEFNPAQFMAVCNLLEFFRIICTARQRTAAKIVVMGQ